MKDLLKRANSNANTVAPNTVAPIDGNEVLRHLLMWFDIGISFESGFLHGLKNLIEQATKTQNLILKYMMILCFSICLTYYCAPPLIQPKKAKPQKISEESRKTAAFRECGRALVAMHTYGALPVHKATIVPGMVSQLPDKDQTHYSRKQMLARLDVYMGGRVAEELIFGESEVTSATASDLSHATSLAIEMVTKHGMSTKVGPVTHNYYDNGRSMSSETKLLIEKEVKNLLERAYNNAKFILTTNEKELDALANALLEDETLTGSQIMDLLAKVKSQHQQAQSHWFQKLLQWP